MPALDFASNFSFISALSAAPLRPLHTLVRTTHERFSPPRVVLHRPSVTREQVGVEKGVTEKRATIWREIGSGRTPTIVLGGFVPDSTEQVFLLRRFLLRSGDIYYVHYSRDGFSLDVVCAQLSDLAAELETGGQPPVVFGVSFGAGIILEWLRRARLEGRKPTLAGIVLVSPVACVADIIAPGATKPTTLVGRALKPLLDPDSALSEAGVEKARAVFRRMFEAGAQNKLALKMVMSSGETERLRNAVIATIANITPVGARERVQALGAMLSPTDYFSPSRLPLSDAPTLILFAEREDAVYDAGAPVRFAFDRAARAYFPHAKVQVVTAGMGQSAVQHASLIFHVFEFLPPLHAFYQRVRRSPLAAAA